MILTVCYFGYYDPEYGRNRVLIRGLRENGICVIECNDQSRFLKKYWILSWKLWAIAGQYDAIVVGSMGNYTVPFAKLVSSKPVIFDALAPLYETNVLDRKKVPLMSLLAFWYWFADWFTCWCADMVLVDTEAHARYFSRALFVRSWRMRRIFVGVNHESTASGSFFPGVQALRVHFHGSYIPLHGIEYIIRAAKMVESYGVLFTLVGNGQMREAMESLSVALDVHNVTFTDTVPFGELSTHIRQSDVCLGIFGVTEKAQRVIPHKVYEYAILKKAIITADTPAIRELFSPDDLILIDAGNADSLARALIRCASDRAILSHMGERAYTVVTARATSLILGAQLKEIISALL